ncbi:MAG: hypothetical protein JSU09_02605 [Bacteroidetes bacterium]|nr:hypothetical protein [Bacteroidota bacterium]
MRRIASSIVLLALVGAFMFSLEGCGDEPDPCKGLKPVYADFKFQDKFSGIDSLFTIDTVLMEAFQGAYYKRLIFTASESDAKYNWLVGENIKTFTEQTFFLDFTQPYGSIETKLTVNKAPNKSCFPSDDGIDSVTKRLYLLEKSNFKYAFEGTFTGHLTTSPKDQFDIIITNFGQSPSPDPLDPPGNYGLRVFNLPKGCGRNKVSPSEYSPEITQTTFRNFLIEHKYTSSPNGEVFPCGEVFTALGRVYSGNNKIEITFLEYDISKKKFFPTRKQFLGIRKK